MKDEMLIGGIAAVMGLVILAALMTLTFKMGKEWVAESCDLYGKVQIVDKMYTCEREYER